jgi:prevent-host-death family protein
VEVNVQTARQQLREILDRVSGGEHIVVTRRGAPVAAIVPVPGDREEDERSERPLGLASYAGALARLDGLAETVSTVVSLRSVARDREPPELR